MDKQKLITERLKKISDMLESTEEFLDRLDFYIPDLAKNKIIEVLQQVKPEEILEDIKNRRPPRFVIMGRTGIGKSSLINAMFGAYLAKTSAVEVGTKSHKFYKYMKDDEVIFEVIDTRGIREGEESANCSAEEELDQLIQDLKPDAFIFLTNAADRSALRDEAEELRRIYERMSFKVPLITVINRVDELHPARLKDPAEYTAAKLASIEEKEEQVRRIFAKSGLEEMFLVSVSSYIEWDAEDLESLSSHEREQLQIGFDGRYNIDLLLDLIEENIDFRAAVDFVMNFRGTDEVLGRIGDEFVKKFSEASALVGVTPIPVADVLILLPLQVIEVVLIAYLGGREVNVRSAREFIVNLGAVAVFGFALRFVAQQGSKLLNIVPGAGSVVSGGIAYSGTYSIGKAAIAYYIKGMSLKETRRLAKRVRMEAEGRVSD